MRVQSFFPIIHHFSLSLSLTDDLMTGADPSLYPSLYPSLSLSLRLSLSLSFHHQKEREGKEERRRRRGVEEKSREEKRRNEKGGKNFGLFKNIIIYVCDGGVMVIVFVCVDTSSPIK
jgi:hypothetical protein